MQKDKEVFSFIGLQPAFPIKRLITHTKKFTQRKGKLYLAATLTHALLISTTLMKST